MALRQECAAIAVVFPSVPPYWREAFGAVEAEAFRGADADPWNLLSRYADLMGALSLRYGSPPDADGFRRAAERLLEHYPNRAWSVPELATALNTTPRRLTYRLTAATGLSPAAWVRRWRVQKARRLLIEEGCTVTEASKRLGFTNPYHFSRVVRAETGESPSALRRKSSASPVIGLRR